MPAECTCTRKSSEMKMEKSLALAVGVTKAFTAAGRRVARYGSGKGEQLPLAAVSVATGPGRVIHGSGGHS